MNNVVINPYEYFADPTKGRPIFNGSIYVGMPDTDPEVPANQKQVYARQENGTEVAIPQPITTNAGGYPTYNGSVIGIIVDGYYSIKVNDKNGVQALYCANRFSWDYTNPNDLLVTATGTTTPRRLADRFGDVISVKDFGAVSGGGVDCTQAFVDAIATGKIVEGATNETYLITTPLTDIGTFRGNGCKIVAPNGFINLDRSSSYLAPTQDYAAGDREYKTASTAGIENNSIISIRSTDLLNTERAYYYKGVNSKVTVIDGSTLALSTACPFDLPQSTLSNNTTTGVYIYSPKSVVLSDFKLTGDLTTDTGIYIEGCSVSIDKVNVSGYILQGIGLQRCVDVSMKGVTTYNTTTYGAVLYSCTNVLVKGGSYSSAGVGFDTGGNEPCFNCTWIGGSYVSTNGAKGFSQHANMWDSLLINCAIQGINLSGHAQVIGGTLTSEADQGSNYFYLHVGNEHWHNSYKFSGVTFVRKPTIRLAGQSQVSPTGRNKLDSLILENCNGIVNLYLDLALTSSLPDRCNIKTLKMISSDVNLTHRDDIEYLDISNSKNSSINRTIEQLPNVTTPDGYIGHFTVRDTTMSILNEDIQIGKFNTGVLSNVNLLAGTSFRIQDAAGVLSFRDCQFTNATVFRTDGLLRLLSDNTKITIHGAYIPNIATYIQRDEY